MKITCSKCEKEIFVGVSAVWHFINQHPEIIYTMLEEDYQETFMGINYRLKLLYINKEPQDEQKKD